MDIELKNDTYFLSGRLDEFAELDALLRAKAPLKLNLTKLVSINSIGVRKFLAFTLAWSPRRFEFSECRPEFIANVNVIPQLLGTSCDPSQIKSFFAPFSCTSCKRVESILLKPADFRFSTANEASLSERRCSRCAEVMALDIEPGEYFAFLQQKPRP